MYSLGSRTLVKLFMSSVAWPTVKDPEALQVAVRMTWFLKTQLCTANRCVPDSEISSSEPLGCCKTRQTCSARVQGELDKHRIQQELQHTSNAWHKERSKWLQQQGKEVFFFVSPLSSALTPNANAIPYTLNPKPTS